MESANLAIFQFQRFSVPKFSFEEPEPKFSIVDVQFNPSGIYNTSNGEFKLTITFKAVASTEQTPKDYREVLSGNLDSHFLFENKPSHAEIPDYFYANSMAIVYPYIRAFISNI